MGNNKVIRYTAKVLNDYGAIVYKLNRFFDNPGSLIGIANTLLENVSDDGKVVRFQDSEYDKWIRETFKDIQIYYTTTPTFDNMVKKHLTMMIPTGIPYKEYKEKNLKEVYTNLLLSDEQIQLRYAVQYCNHDDYNVKMIACDLLRHRDIIEFTNKGLLKLIINGEVDKIEEMML